MEEKIWNYIDGNCTPEEQQAIMQLIAGDEGYRLKYQQLTALDKEFTMMELDEPPMGFTYNVMETIRSEQASVPLKATINKRIIWGIAAFFVITLGVSFVLILSNISLSAVDISLPAPHVNFTMPDLSNYVSKPFVEGFLFFDTVLALFFLDSYFRKRVVARLEKPL